MVSAQHHQQRHERVCVIVQALVARDPPLGLHFRVKAEKRVTSAIAAYDGYVEANAATARAHNVLGHLSHMALMGQQ